MATIFECDKVTKAYGGLMAVKEVSFAIEPGEIFAIVGPNGAGKTTLFDTISGISLATGGKIRFNGQEKTNVEEYCISEGWIRMAVGRSRDRHGNPMTLKMSGKVEPYYEEAPAGDADAG